MRTGKHVSNRFTYVRSTTSQPMSDVDRRSAEGILAKWIARAYAADHPELFGPKLNECLLDGPH